MPETSNTSQSYTSKLARRKIRKAILDNVEGASVTSHVDGSLTIVGKRSTVGTQLQFAEKIKDVASREGHTLRFLSMSPAEQGIHTLIAAAEATVAQGLCGAIGYRGTGEFALQGQKAEAWQAESQPKPKAKKRKGKKAKAEAAEPSVATGEL